MTDNIPTYEELDAQLEAIRSQAHKEHEKAIVMFMDQIRINAGLIEALRNLSLKGELDPAEIMSLSRSFSKMLSDAEEFVQLSLLGGEGVS
ncbi:hypothetical protein [uncultured Croceicoccus sp.]|uniref:hypothetical protein n=1 Tax=uncultured Croceicoccus sp. TaxID=1295329 RepID=UPI002618F81F|nr:hypothetical protein [uncultured Croceicoccus sp.]